MLSCRLTQSQPGDNGVEPAREAEDRHAAPRGQGAMLLAPWFNEGSGISAASQELEPQDFALKRRQEGTRLLWTERAQVHK